MEMDFLRRLATCSRLEKIRNIIREKLNIKNYVLDYVRNKQLNVYDHVQRIDEERLRRKILEFFPPGRKRRRKRRPRNSWIQEVITGIREKGINNMKWFDREEWRRKIKLNFRHRKM